MIWATGDLYQPPVGKPLYPVQIWTVLRIRDIALQTVSFLHLMLPGWRAPSASSKGFSTFSMIVIVCVQSATRLSAHNFLARTSLYSSCPSSVVVVRHANVVKHGWGRAARPNQWHVIASFKVQPSWTTTNLGRIVRSTEFDMYTVPAVVFCPFSQRFERLCSVLNTHCIGLLYGTSGENVASRATPSEPQPGFG